MQTRAACVRQCDSSKSTVKALQYENSKQGGIQCAPNSRSAAGCTDVSSHIHRPLVGGPLTMATRVYVAKQFMIQFAYQPGEMPLLAKYSLTHFVNRRRFNFKRDRGIPHNGSVNRLNLFGIAVDCQPDVSTHNKLSPKPISEQPRQFRPYVRWQTLFPPQLRQTRIFPEHGLTYYYLWPRVQRWDGSHRR